MPERNNWVFHDTANRRGCRTRSRVRALLAGTLQAFEAFKGSEESGASASVTLGHRSADVWVHVRLDLRQAGWLQEIGARVGRINDSRCSLGRADVGGRNSPGQTVAV